MAKINIFGRTLNYCAYQDPLYLDRIRLRVLQDKSFVRVFQYNRTDEFFRMLKEVTDPTFMFENNTIISISGFTGTGKTTVALSLAHNTTPERFDIDNVCFFDEEILDLAGHVARDSFIVRDEAVGKARYGIGSNRIKAEVGVLVETTRKYGLSIIFIEPKEIENDLIEYYLQTVDMDFEQRITRLALKDGRTGQFIGAVYVPILPETHPLIQKYNRMKDRFIESVRHGKAFGDKSELKHLAVELMDSIDHPMKKNELHALAIVRYPKMTTSEIRAIVSLVSLMQTHGTEALDDV